MANEIVVHINQAPTGPIHPEPLPPHRIVRSCVEVHGFPRCMGAAAMGPERCTCDDTLTAEQRSLCIADAWAAHRARKGESCHDCAFRAGSPEQDILGRIIAQPETAAFRCHQGMPVDARRGTPAQDCYKLTNAQADAYPVCAGWRRAHAAWLLGRRAP